VREETLLCAISVFSVPLWLTTTTASLPRRHREHRDCTEKNPKMFYSIDNLAIARELCKRLFSLSFKKAQFGTLRVAVNVPGARPSIVTAPRISFPDPATTPAKVASFV